MLSGPGLGAAHTRDVHYAYDLRGLQTEARFDSLSGGGVSKRYDGFGRLVSTTSSMGGTARTLGSHYDSAGNRILLSGDSGYSATFRYDQSGRMTASGRSIDRLRPGRPPLEPRHGRGSSSAAYAYDGAGRLESLTHDLAATAGDQKLGFAYNRPRAR